MIYEIRITKKKSKPLKISCIIFEVTLQHMLQRFATANVFLKMMKLFGSSLKTNDSCKMHADLENKHGAICEKFY